LFTERKCNARCRGHEWKLSPEYFKVTSTQKCHYFGTNPKCNGGMDNRFSGEKHFKSPRLKGAYIDFTGLDRVDNAPLYSESNTVPCCLPCNAMKCSVSPKMVELLYYDLHGRGLMPDE
jgi:hypothetical protein